MLNEHDALARAKLNHARRFGRSRQLRAAICNASTQRLADARRSYTRRFIRVIDQSTGTVSDWSTHGARLELIAVKQPEAARPTRKEIRKAIYLSGSGGRHLVHTGGIEGLPATIPITCAEAGNRVVRLLRAIAVSTPSSRSVGKPAGRTPASSPSPRMAPAP